MLVVNIESIGGQKRREILAGQAHDEGVTGLISNDFVKVLLDDQLSGVTDLLVLEVDRFEIEHASIVWVQNLILNHLIEVFQELDTLEHISLGVERRQHFLGQLRLDDLKVLVVVDVLQNAVDVLVSTLAVALLRLNWLGNVDEGASRIILGILELLRVDL
jgi:hypothetical protein